MIKLHFVLLGLLAVLTLCRPAWALVYVEDFEDDLNPGQAGFASAIFDHDVEPMLGARDPDWGFSQLSNNPANYCLYLSFMEDEIIFSLEPDQYIESASISLNGMNGPAGFIATGTEDTFVAYASVHHGGWITVDTSTSPVDIGTIMAITLQGFNGQFDDLMINVNVVPEPATVLLFGLGALALRCRRRL